MPETEETILPYDQEAMTIPTDLDIPPEVSEKEDEHPKRPLILAKIDEIISRARPALVEKIRRIRSDVNIQFQGMTKAEIYAKFNVDITGGENSAQLRAKQSQAVKLRREASSYLRNAMSSKSLLKNAFESAKDMVDAELVASNLTAPRDSKISDKARETISKQVYSVGVEDETDILAHSMVEASIWESVVSDMDVTIKEIQNDMMSIASENKLNAR